MKRVFFAVMALLMISVDVVWGQEATPEATALPLTEIYTSADDMFSFNYPEGLLLRETQSEMGYGVYLATDADLFDMLSQEITSGGVLMNVSITDLNFMVAEGVEFSPETLLAGMASALGSKGEDTLFDELTTLTVNEFSAALGIKNLGEAENAMLIVDYGDGLTGIIVVSAAPDELNQWIPTALAIAETITYNPLSEATPEPAIDLTPEAVPDAIAALVSATYTSEDGEVSISYPEEWFIREIPDQDTRFEITSFDRDFSLPGDVTLAVRIGTLEEIYPGLEGSDITYVEILEGLHDGLEPSAAQNDLIYLSEVALDNEGLYPKAIMIYVVDDDGQVIMMADLGDEYLGLFILKASPDDLPDYLAIAWVVVDSVQIHDVSSE